MPTDRLSESYLETLSAHVSAVLSSQHKREIFATYKGRNKLTNAFMQPLCNLFGSARQIMA